LVQKRFEVSARLSNNNQSATKPVLELIIGNKETVKPMSEGFEANAELTGESAKHLNRPLLSEMLRVEKKSRIRAQWTSGDTVERYFDYVPNASRKANMH
jgi:hypothetical protein